VSAGIRPQPAAALIIAGGQGTRFWPASRANSPKPLFRLSGKTTLLEDTIARHHTLITRDRIFVLVSASQRSAFEAAADGLIPPENLLVEPHGRGTAVAISYGAGLIASRLGEVTLVIAPADHYVTPAAGYRRTIAKALKLAAAQKSITVIGITPTRPDPGLGYQKIGSKVGDGFRVAKFVEKPPPSVARSMVRSGRFLWNSGVFVITLETLQRELASHAPPLARMTHELASKSGRISASGYGKLKFNSFDYTVVEKSDRVTGLRAQYRWHDVGSWEGLWEALRGTDNNATSGNVVALDTSGVLARSDRRLMVLLGVDDLVAVDTADAILIARRSRSQEIRRVIDELARRGLGRYL
jgi:mannose-1-phosphate guanylyltransferase/mannose-6-phosphate isomerase